MAWYIAWSACLKSVSASAACSGYSATPIDAPTWKTRIGDLEGLVERGGDPLARGLRGAARVLVAAGAEQEQELVAALARQHVAGPREVRDAARGLGQHRVAGLVAERVVDELEVVEVEVEERERAVGAAGAAEVAADLRLQERAVRRGR